ASGDLRRTHPRFQGEAWVRNLQRLQAFAVLAREAGCTPPAFALAWLLARGPHVIPIPGTTSLDHLRDDLGAARLRLPAHLMEAAESLFPADACGPRYPAASQSEVDTEQFGAVGV
ncbi:MAG: aldo/keto reductase, partial [Rubrivivax sp.]